MKCVPLFALVPAPAGQPTGVKLTHANLAYQVNNLHNYLEFRPGEKLLSLLPPWWVFL